MEYDSNLMQEKTNEEEIINRWDIIKSYFDKQHLQRLVRHQIESYNDFVNNQIQKTIDMFNPVYVHSIHYKHEELDIYMCDWPDQDFDVLFEILWHKYLKGKHLIL